ncbi:hypothetical protein F5876DRAFT_27924, partial [Lentinula aff. lateritia]
CTVYVDVRLSDGENTSPLFIDIAKSLGAKVVRSVRSECSHIVYTSGRQTTVEQYLALDEERRPIAVGAAWLKDCRDAATRLPEASYLVDMEEQKT